MDEFKTIKQAIKEMTEFMNAGKSEHIKDPQQFAKTIISVLEGLSYKVEELERNIGPSSAFIDPNDAPHRLR